MNAAVVADEKDAGIAWHEGLGVVIDVGDVVSERGAGVTASNVVPVSAGAGNEPCIEGVEEDAIRIVGIDSNALVVPVLWIVAAAGRAYSRALRSGVAACTQRIAV